jgi:hypothetical protein
MTLESEGWKSYNNRSCSRTLQCSGVKERQDKKPKPIREESFSSKLFFKKNDFGYINKIVDPNRRRRDGPKGYPASSTIFMAVLLMYLKSMESILDLVRFLNSNPEWLVALGLKRTIDGKVQYKVPDRSTFYKFANKLGFDKIVQIFSVMDGCRAYEVKRDKERKGVS